MYPRLRASVLSFFNASKISFSPHFFWIIRCNVLSLSEPAPASKMVRAVLVTATSLALTGAVVAHAYLLKHQFYPTVVYLTKSSPSMAVSETK